MCGSQVESAPSNDEKTLKKTSPKASPMGSRTPPTSDIVEGRDAGLGLEDVLCGWRWCCHRTSKTRDARERRTSMCSSRPCCAPLTMWAPPGHS